MTRRTTGWPAAAALALAAAACGPVVRAPHHHTASPAASTPASPAPAPTGTWPPGWVLPGHALTPGATAPGYGLADVCPHVNPALEAQRPTSAQKARVYAAYGLPYPQPRGRYELDHLIPIELGGAPDSPVNEWPEPNTAPDPAVVRAEHLDPAFVENPKDVVEDVLHRLVCSGRVPLATAQRAIAADWRAAYTRYVGGQR